MAVSVLLFCWEKGAECAAVMATTATMLAHISWGPLYLTPWSALPPSAHICAVTTAPVAIFGFSSLFQLCLFLLYILCSFFCFFFLFHLLPPCHWSLSVIEVHWTKSLWRTEGFSASLALEQGLLSPVTSRGPRCAAGESSCVPSSQAAMDLAKVQVCCPF